jgi:hypothetical protein
VTVPGFLYNTAKVAVASGLLAWPTAPLNMLLVDAASGYGDIADPDVDFLSGLPAATIELATTGYARQPLAGLAVNRNDVDDRSEWIADDVVFPTLGTLVAGPTVAGAIVFVQVSDDTDSWPVLWLPDVAGTVNGTDFTVTLDPSGIVRLRAA